MKERFQQWYLKFQLLAPREKFLICLSVLAVILFVWYVFIHEPLLKGIASAEKGQSATAADVELLKVEMTGLEAAANKNPNAIASRRFDELSKEIARLDEQISQYTNRLVTPRAMVTILRDMLVETKELNLLSLRSLAPEIVFDASAQPLDESANESNEKAVSAPPPDRSLKLYRHAVEVRLQGDYFTTMNYLRRLETLQRNVLWQGVEYEVTEYPDAEITIKIYTLSFQRGVIGV